MVIGATLCEIVHEGKLLLQRKRRGRFGEGRWNGPGGKLNLGESPEDGCRREVFEETGVRLGKLVYHGVLRHFFGEVEEPDWAVHIFSTTEINGDIKENEEGELRWFSLKQIPYKEMWQDDSYWLPLVIEGKMFEGEFYFNDDGSRLLRHRLWTVNITS